MKTLFTSFSSLVGIVAFCLAFDASGKEYELLSPDGHLSVAVSINSQVDMVIQHGDVALIRVLAIALEIDGTISGTRPMVKKVHRRSFAGIQKPVIKEKNATIEDRFNEITFIFKDSHQLVFRAYNEGIAYRFLTDIDGPIVINNESATLVFDESVKAWLQKERSFRTAYEVPYQHLGIDQVEADKFVLLPALFQNDHDISLLVTESDLEDYPGLRLKGSGSNELGIVFPPYPLEESHEGSVYGHGQVSKCADYIAKTTGSRSYPWRIFAIAEKDADLIDNQMVYLLGGDNQVEGTDWIKPGVVTFDWWGRRNIYGVDFVSGVNTTTAKYFIDFASEFGFEYFLLDDGWTDNSDLFNVNPDLDIEEVARYAKEKNVGLMLWLMWHTLDRQMEEALDLFQSWGVKGLKVDFMNRDDQKMVNFYYRVAKEAAERQMVIDFHGAYKPAGLRKKYPNVLTREALIEVEQNGGHNWADPELHCLLPFIRMVAGPMDYIPGTMNNAQKKDFRLFLITRWGRAPERTILLYSGSWKVRCKCCRTDHRTIIEKGIARSSLQRFQLNGMKRR